VSDAAVAVEASNTEKRVET